MPLPPGRFIVDTHQDIAWHCQEFGRDLMDTGKSGCMITLPRLKAAGIRLICATLFTTHGRPAAERRVRLAAQYKMYEHWFREFPQELIPIRTKGDLQRLAEMMPVDVDGRVGYPTGVLLLMEGLELVNSHAELAYWHSCGVRMASLSWNGVNQFASGVFGDAAGLRPAGFELLREFRRMGLILDLAHLNDAGIADVLESYEGPLCSSHTNARSVAGHQRNLTDPQINAIAVRGGVIGLNLLAPFVVHNWRRGDPQPEIAAVTAHAAHLTDLVGPGHVGIGSDLDGGLTPENTPRGIDRVDHLPLLAEDLARCGWPTEHITGFLGANWWRFFERSLPN